MERNVPIYVKIVILVIITCLVTIYTEFGISKAVLKQARTAIAPVHESIKVKGVLDRLEDYHMAVLLVEEVNKEIIVPEHILPVGSRVNMWFDLVLRNEDIVAVSIDWQSTIEQIGRTGELMDKLQEKE